MRFILNTPSCRYPSGVCGTGFVSLGMARAAAARKPVGLRETKLTCHDGFYFFLLPNFDKNLLPELARFIFDARRITRPQLNGFDPESGPRTIVMRRQLSNGRIVRYEIRQAYRNYLGEVQSEALYFGNRRIWSTRIQQLGGKS